MKRIVTFIVENGRNKIQSISAPMRAEDISVDLDPSTYGVVDANFIAPQGVDGKKTLMYYNADTQMIEFEYVDIGFEDLNPQQRIEFLKEENAKLKEELNLTQTALFDLDRLVNTVNDIISKLSK